MAGTRRLNHGRRRTGALVVLGTLVLLAAGLHADAAAETAGRIERIELEGDGPSTKIVIRLSRPLAYEVHVLDGDATRKSARRLVLDFADTTLAPAAAKPIDVASDLLRQIRPGQFNARTARIVLDLASDATHSIGATDSPPEVTIALDGTAAVGMPASVAEASQPAAVVPTPAEHAQPAAAVAEAPKPVASSAPRTIPIRARGRRPYSLIYSR